MSEHYILILKASPRRQSNSSLLADQLAAGASATGAEVESFFLPEMNIRPCDACDVCQGSGDGQCVVQDDMQMLYPKLRRASAIVVATPVYWFTLSAQAKLCIDRWYALETPEGSALRGKKFALLMSYGDSDPYLAGAVNAIRTFQDMCRYLHADLAGMVYGTASQAGEMRQQPDLLEKAYQLGQKLASSSPSLL